MILRRRLLMDRLALAFLAFWTGKLPAIQQGHLLRGFFVEAKTVRKSDLAIGLDIKGYHTDGHDESLEIMVEEFGRIEPA